VKPFLIVDCYVGGDGAMNFQRLLSGQPQGVYRALHEPPPSDVLDWSGIVISGSAASVTSPEPWMDGLADLVRDAVDGSVPVLGVCFGHQMVAHALYGLGAVRRAETPEIGWRDIEVLSTDSLLAGLGGGFRTFESHFDEVSPDIDGLQVLARSRHCAVQAFRLERGPVWGVQFHAEMALEEARDLANRRIGGRPDLGLDLERELSRAVDSAWLAERILANFAAHCETHR
jgi:GMP synthase (glutamine-hydrolysing)